MISAMAGIGLQQLIVLFLAVLLVWTVLRRDGPFWD